jgi:hypothetical protein
MVNPDAALGRYPGGKEEAEQALLAVFQITNKGIAHVTEDIKDNPDHGRLIEIASRGVPSLVVSYLYTTKVITAYATAVLNLSPRVSVRLDVCGLDDPRPFFDFALDEFFQVVR